MNRIIFILYYHYKIFEMEGDENLFENDTILN